MQLQRLTTEISMLRLISVGYQLSEHPVNNRLTFTTLHSQTAVTLANLDLSHQQQLPT